MRLELPLRRMRVLCAAGGGHYTGSLDLRALLLRLAAVTVGGRRRRSGRARGVAEVAATTAVGTRLMLQEQQAGHDAHDAEQARCPGRRECVEIHHTNS